jgi:hypothetical protein
VITHPPDDGADKLLKSFEHVLANINKLNRSLEAVIAVCSALPPIRRYSSVD